MDKLVSIITPTYNSAKYIAETIQSVQSQTYTNWEMLIVDDCSSDDTVLIVEDFIKEDSRIKIFKLDINSGSGVARNLGITKAEGDYIAFLDADDLWKPQKLKIQIEFMIKHKLPFVFSYYQFIDEDGKVLNEKVEAPIKLSYRQLFFCNYVGNLTGIYDVKFFGKIPIHSIRKRQDWMMWLSILKVIKWTMPVPEVLAYYRLRNNSISASKFALIKYNYQVYRSFHKLNIISSLFCMMVFLFVQLFIKPTYIKKL